MNADPIIMEYSSSDAVGFESIKDLPHNAPMSHENCNLFYVPEEDFNKLNSSVYDFKKLLKLNTNDNHLLISFDQKPKPYDFVRYRNECQRLRHLAPSLTTDDFDLDNYDSHDIPLDYDRYRFRCSPDEAINLRSDIFKCTRTPNGEYILTWFNDYELLKTEYNRLKKEIPSLIMRSGDQ